MKMNELQSSSSRNPQSGMQRSEAGSERARTSDLLGITAEVRVNCHGDTEGTPDCSALGMLETLRRGGDTRVECGKGRFPWHRQQPVKASAVGELVA